MTEKNIPFTGVGLVPDGKEQLEDISFECVQRLGAIGSARTQILEFVVIDMQEFDRGANGRFFDKAPASCATNEIIARRQSEGITGQWTEFFVAAAEIRRLRPRENVAEEMRTCLIVVTEFGCESPRS